MFLESAVATLLSATIEFIYICAAASMGIRSFCEGKLVLMIGDLGIIPKTRSEGTRPFSPIVSFIAFTAILNKCSDLVRGSPLVLF